jgi:hypothetical protein
MPSPYHASLSLSRELWEDLLSAALPVRVAGGAFHVARDARGALRQLQLRERVATLLEDRRAPDVVVKARDRARELWSRSREDVYRTLNDWVRVEGTYRLELDDLGSRFRYGQQKVTANAYMKGTVEGVISLVRDNVEIPFRLEKRVGVSVTLGDIHFERSEQAVVGSLKDIGLHLGDPTVLQLLSRLGEYLLEQQLPQVSPVTILRREHLDGMVGGLGESMRMRMGVERLDLLVDEDNLTLTVKFGFAHEQLEAANPS